MLRRRETQIPLCSSQRKEGRNRTQLCDAGAEGASEAHRRSGGESPKTRPELCAAVMHLFEAKQASVDHKPLEAPLINNSLVLTKHGPAYQAPFLHELHLI